MRSTFALAALAGVALAAPHYGARPDQKDVVWVVETIVDIVTVTDNGDYTPAATYAAQPASYSAPAVVTSVYQASAYTPAPYSASAPSSAPASKPTSAASTPAPSATGTGYMAIVNQYRGIMGKPALTQDATLEQNDLSCLQASPGQMNHVLNSGTFGQVLAPGGPDDFLHVFVGGWLCEKPSLLGADSSQCDTQSQGWIYDGTGHADILSSTSYTKIGCQNYDGIWGCDLA